MAKVIKDPFEKVMERLRNLLALSKSPNEAEASRAFERAQIILAEHNLSMADLEEPTGAVIADEEMVTSAYPWRRKLGTATASMFFCAYMYNTQKRGKTAYDVHAFVGKRHNVTVAKLMFGYLMTTVDRLAHAASRNIAKDQQSPYRVSFRNACTSRLCARIAERIMSAKAGEVKGDTGRALMLVDAYKLAASENQTFLKDNGYSTEVVVQNARTDLHRQGAADGYRVGGEIGLDHQVGGTVTARLR